MPPVYLRGGLPQHINDTAPTGVQQWEIAQGSCNSLLFSNTGANAILLTLTSKTDADAGVGYTIPAGEERQLPAEVGRFWTNAQVGSSTFEAIAFVTRG